MDEQTIRSWGDIWPDGDIGVVLGKVSNLIVLEVSWLQEGGQVVEQYVESNGALPVTLSAHVSKFKQRFFFSYPDFPLPAKTEIAEGLTLYGNEHILSLPSNRFSLKAEDHTWDEPYASDPTIASAPHWLFEQAGLVPENYQEAVIISHQPRVHLDFFNRYEEVWLQRTPWRLEPFSARGSITTLVGDGGKEVGKTRFLQGMAYSMLTGSPFLGNKPERGAVLYFSEQDPAPFLAGLKSVTGNVSGFVDLHTLHAHQYPDMALDKLMQGALTAKRDTGADTLIIDSLQTFAAGIGDDEIIRALDPLLGAGMSVIVSTETVDGHDHLLRASDIVLSLAGLPYGASGNERRLSCRSRFPNTNLDAAIALQPNGSYQYVERDLGLDVPMRRMIGQPRQVRERQAL